MKENIFGVRTSLDGLWFYGSEVRGGKVTSLDTNIIFATRMTKAQAEAVAEVMEAKTDAFWYVVAVARRGG